MSDKTTINNAMKGQIPGTVTLQVFNTSYNSFVEFIPFYRDNLGFWVGTNSEYVTKKYHHTTHCCIIRVDATKYSIPTSDSNNNNNVDTFSVGIRDIGKITKITKSRSVSTYASISSINLNNGETRGTVNIGGILFEIKNTIPMSNYYTVSRRSICGQAVFTSFV